jgi:hypothetical protein
MGAATMPEIVPTRPFWCAVGIEDYTQCPASIPEIHQNNIDEQCPESLSHTEYPAKGWSKYTSAVGFGQSLWEGKQLMWALTHRDVYGIFSHCTTIETLPSRHIFPFQSIASAGLVWP